MGDWGIWLPVVLPAVGGALAAIKNWQPWEIVALVAALAPAGAAGAWAWAWYAIRTRTLNEAPFGSDEQIARALGDALGGAHPWVDTATVAEVWAAHAALPTDRRRELALAVLGLVRGCMAVSQYSLRESVKATVRGFVPKADAPALDAPDAAARTFGAIVGRCSPYTNGATTDALWAAFAALPADRRPALVAALDGFTAATELEYHDDIDGKLLAAVAAFRTPTPEPVGTP